MIVLIFIETRLVDDAQTDAIDEAVIRRQFPLVANLFPFNQPFVPLVKSMPRTPDGLVVNGPLGSKNKPDTLRNILVKKILTPLISRFPATAGEKGFEDGRLHSFRHLFCSQCANHGVA